MCVGAALRVTFRKVSAIISNIYVYCRALLSVITFFVDSYLKRIHCHTIFTVVSLVLAALKL